MRRISIALGTLLLVSSVAAGARTAELQTWLINPLQSEVRFTVTKFGFSDVTGTFRESSGEIRYDPGNPASSSINWRVRVASVRTDATSRDASLQQTEYFDTAHHPELIFTSREVRPLPDQALRVTGDLTMRGATRPLSIDVRIRNGATGPIFETDFAVDRYNFGIAGGTIMGRLIGRQVRVHILAVTQPPPTAITRR